MKKKLYYYIYRTTNLINGMKYVGRRTCNCPIEDDDYLGSGTAFKKALELYGRQNFQKEILKVCKNEAELYRQEEKITHELDVVRSREYYNMVYGGAPRPAGFEFAEEEIEKMNYLEEMMIEEMENNGTIYAVKVNNRTEEHKRPQVILSYIEIVGDKIIGHFFTLTDDLFGIGKSKIFGKGGEHFTHRYMDKDVISWLHKEGYMLINKDKCCDYYRKLRGFGEFNNIVNEINLMAKTYKAPKNVPGAAVVSKSDFISKSGTITSTDSNMNHIKRIAKTSKDYRYFMELYNIFEDLGFTNVYHAVTGSGSITAADAEIIRSGKLKCSAKDAKKAYAILEYEAKFKDIVDAVGGRGDYFKIAIAFCFNHPDVDNNVLLKRLRKNYDKMTRIQSIRDALHQIERVYNYRRNPKVSIEHDYLRSRNIR